MICGLCQYEFSPEEAGSACSGCPVSKGCHLICCPRCGYEMPPEAKLITLWKSLRNRAGKSKQVNHDGEE